MVNKFPSFIKRYKKDKPLYKEDLLTRMGRQQIQTMIDRGIELPIVPLK